MEDNGCLKAISYPAGYWVGVFIGAAIFKDTGVAMICGIAGVVGVYFLWKAYEEEQKEARRREEENRRWRQEQERKERKRNEAVELARKYPEATKHYFDLFWNIKKSVIYDSDITVDRAEKLLSKRYSYESDEMQYNSVFRAKIEEQKAAERRRQEAKREAERREAERKRREEELARRRKEDEKRNLVNTLPACVATWSSHSNSLMKHKYFYDYYTYAVYKDNASASMWETWRIVWHFKNDPSRNISDYEHESALQTVINLVENALRSAFGSKTEYLTLVCLTASTQRKTELRNKKFAETVCRDLNMTNAYSHIQVIAGGTAKHEGGEGFRGVSYDRYFFNGKYVVLFDDVRTTGNSLEQERQTLEGFGAKVICAVTIAQTVH
jgi:predicted amidophosphoribosyltransferase